MPLILFRPFLKYPWLIVLILIVMPTMLSCGHRIGQGTVKDSTRVAGATTTYGRYNPDSDFHYNRQRYKIFNPADYPVSASRTLGHYLITVLEYKQDAETNPDGSPPPARAIEAQYILLLKDQETGKSDTLVPNISTIEYLDQITVKDLTKDLGFNKLVFCLEYQGEDDNFFDKVFGFKGDMLSELFDIGGLEDLKRKNKDTLFGHRMGRDDLLGLGQEYNITVSLPDYNVDVQPPDTMVFDYETHAKDTIQALRISRPGALQGIPYTILPGTILTIDTFFNQTKIITLHIGDSIFIRGTFDQLRSRVQGNDAG